jgi:hypothetical protein
MLYPLDAGQEAMIEASPARHFDLGEGRGKPVSKKLTGGVCGVVIDTRGRPLVLPKDKAERINALNKWAKIMNLYPE